MDATTSAGPHRPSAARQLPAEPGSGIGTAGQRLPCTAEDEDLIAVRDGEPGALTVTGAE
jgi:hypothetical protein